jgi:hypothetical protein
MPALERKRPARPSTGLYCPPLFSYQNAPLRRFRGVAAQFRKTERVGAAEGYSTDLITDSKLCSNFALGDRLVSLRA